MVQHEPQMQLYVFKGGLGGCDCMGEHSYRENGFWATIRKYKKKHDPNHQRKQIGSLDHCLYSMLDIHHSYILAGLCLLVPAVVTPLVACCLLFASRTPSVSS